MSSLYFLLTLVSIGVSLYFHTMDIIYSIAFLIIAIIFGILSAILTISDNKENRIINIVEALGKALTGFKEDKK